MCAMRRHERFLAYGVGGWVFEVLFTGLKGPVRDKEPPHRVAVLGEERLKRRCPHDPENVRGVRSVRRAPRSSGR